MNIDRLISILKIGNITIPLFLIHNYQKLDINAECLIILGYLLNKDNTLDYKKIGKDLNIDDKLVLDNINKLQEKGLLSINVKKNEKGIMEEHLSLDSLYNKLSLILIEDSNEQTKDELNIYKMFEEEFGRTLSPMEYEIITGWLDSHYKHEIIIAALKEAVYNGANNLRYIDKILFEWNKKGLKRIEDIHKDREKFVKGKKEKIELPDYNWLEEDEE